MKAKEVLARNATTVALVLAAAGGVAYVVVGRDRPTTDELEKRKRNLVPVWRADEVTELRVVAKGKALRLTSPPAPDGGIRRWNAELEGATHPASEQNVDQLLGTLEFASFEREANAAARAEAKLDAPRAELELVMGQSRWKIRVGGPAPSPENCSYAEVEGRGLYVITNQLAAALEVDVSRFRSRRIVPYLSTELSGFTVAATGEAPVSFVRAPWNAGQGGGFRLEGSARGKLRVDASAIDKMLSMLGGLEGEAFLDDAAAKAASRPVVTLTMIPKDAAAPKGVLALGGACPLPDRGALSVAVRSSPSFVGACIPKAAPGAVAAAEEAWIDKRAIAALFDEVTEVLVTRGGAKLELARTGTGYHLRAPEERTVDGAIGTEVLERLLAVVGAKASSAEGARPAGEPLAVLEVTSLAVGAAGDRVEKVSVWPPKDGVALAVREEDGALLELAEASLRDLLPAPLQLRARGVVGAKAKLVRRLRVVARAGKRETVQELTRDESGAFSLTEPKPAGLGPDAGLASELAGAFAELEALRFVAAKDDGSFGLAEPRLVLELDVAVEGGKAPKTFKLLVGAPTDGGFFAKLAGDDAIFVVPKALDAAASRWLLDRAALLLEESDLQDVVVSTKKTKLSLTRKKGGALELSPKQDATKSAQISGALTDLIAEGVVRLGKPEKGEGFKEPELEVTVASDGGKKKVELLFGAGESFRGTPVVLVRKRGVDATFAVARSRVRPLREALGLE